MNFLEIQKTIDEIRKLNNQNKKELDEIINKSFNENNDLDKLNEKMQEIEYKNIQNKINLEKINLDKKINDIKLEQLKNKYKKQTEKILLINFLEQFENLL
tara:strand:- start:424 stop:726 length:303 start_codon:yes stop_codon:yes gene_type:complete